MKERIKDFLGALKLSPRTIFAYRNAIEQFVKAVGGDAKLSVASYVKFLKSLSGKSSSTQKVYTTAVLRFYAFNKHKNLDRLREVTEMYTRKQGQRIVKFNRDAIEQVIDYCSRLSGDLPALRDRAFVLTLADTGLRISEACALKRGDINWIEARAIIIGKGDKQSVIRFSHRSLQVLREYHIACASIEPNTSMSLTAQPVFARHDIRASKKIKPISASGMWTAIKGDPRQGIKGRIEEAGVDRNLVRIHDFRHYFVTMTYLAKGNLKLSQELARHKNISTTVRYAHFGKELDEAYEEIFNKRD